MKKERKPLINDSWDLLIVWFFGIFLFLSFAIPVWAIFFTDGANDESVESLAVLQEMLAEEEDLCYPDLESVGIEAKYFFPLKRGYSITGYGEDDAVFFIAGERKFLGGVTVKPTEYCNDVGLEIAEEAVDSKKQKLVTTFFVDGYRYTVTGQAENGEITEELREQTLAVAKNIIDQ